MGMNYEGALDKVIVNEGGFKLTDIKGDNGGQTYCGISRNFWPKWKGWGLIDQGIKDESALYSLVHDFYYTNFWKPMGCIGIHHDVLAAGIFDYSINVGVRVASRLVQIACGAKPDGYIGPKTIEILNSTNVKVFRNNLFIAKVCRYTLICNKKKAQSKFLLGWINRSIHILRGM